MCTATTTDAIKVSAPVPATNHARDMFGVYLADGDAIVYPDRKGSSLWMNYGRVLEILRSPSGAPTGLRVQSASYRHWRAHTHARPSIVRALDRVARLDG